MRMKTLSFVMGAALGAATMQVSADALLAPFFYIDKTTGALTYYMIKTGGNSIANFGAGYATSAPGLHALHFHYFWKQDWGMKDPAWQKEPCNRSNDYGKVSSQDIVYGSVTGGNLYPWMDKSFGGGTGGPKLSTSTNPVMGFMIIEEKSLTADPLTSVEGDLAGYGYVIGVSVNSILEYKMLNNPESQDGNDWDSPFIAKSLVDMAWWPTPATSLGPKSIVNTAWPTIVVGNNMLTTANSRWGGAVTLYPAMDWFWLAEQGNVYDNDENPVSSATPKDIVCAGWVTRSEILDENADSQTVDGGWGRWAIIPQPDYFGKGKCDFDDKTGHYYGDCNAAGALPLKWEDNSNGQQSLMIETSGQWCPVQAASGNMVDVNANLPY